MGKFRKNRKSENQTISTSSLPDIVFMLLFFFMVTTVMRETTINVKQDLPTATEVKKLEKKSLVSYIYVGALNTGYKKTISNEWKSRFMSEINEPAYIQINDKICENPFSNNPSETSDIQAYMELERTTGAPTYRDEKEIPFMTTSLKCDKNVNMKLVYLIKKELRKSDAFKINYSTKKDD